MILFKESFYRKFTYASVLFTIFGCCSWFLDYPLKVSLSESFYSKFAGVLVSNNTEKIIHDGIFAINFPKTPRTAFLQNTCKQQLLIFNSLSLREKCPHTELFWSVFSHIKLKKERSRFYTTLKSRWENRVDSAMEDYYKVKSKSRILLKYEHWN